VNLVFLRAFGVNRSHFSDLVLLSHLKEEMMKMKKLSRRDFLRLSALATSGLALAACTPQPTSEPEVTEEVTVEVPATPEPATVTVMYPSNEFTEDHIKQLKDEYNITVDFIEEDNNRLNAMWAAGDPPDIWRFNAIGCGPHVMRKQLMPLNAFMDTCEVATWDDMYPIYKKLMYQGAVAGSGKLYGLPKDWSIEFMMFINKAAFEESGLPVPSDEEPLSWADVGDLARPLTKREGDRTLRWGFMSHYGDGTGPNPAFLLEILPQIEGSEPLYSPAMDRVNLSNPKVLEVWKWFTDMALDFAIPSPIDPAPTWFGQLFSQGTLAMVNTGYWYGAMAESEETQGDVMVIPAPYWSTPDKRRDSCVYATSTGISSRTEVPEAAWTVVEYYSFKEPALERAGSGWGIPLLKSMSDLLPQDTEFNAQRYKVLMNELEVGEETLTFNPFQSGFVEKGNYMEQFFADELTLEDAIAAIEEETNTAIQDTIESLL
jgi:multiple sugar transport system substrate-binding protein